MHGCMSRLAEGEIDDFTISPFVVDANDMKEPSQSLCLVLEPCRLSVFIRGRGIKSNKVMNCRSKQVFAVPARLKTN